MLVSKNRGCGPLWLVFAVTGLLIVGGCNQGGYSGPTGTVKGKVTLNGEPVPAGTGVTFVSDDGFAASGRVDSGGNYELSVGGSDNHIPTATYKVMVSESSSSEELAGEEYEKMMEASASGGDTAQPAAEKKEIIPKKYRSTATSGLSFAVESGGNTIDIPLE